MGINTETGFVEYRHIRVIEPAIAVTIRFNVDQNKKAITSSWATLSARDNFCRQKGREIADKAMDSGRSFEYAYDRDMTLSENFISAGTNMIVELSEQHETLPAYKKVVDKNQFEKVFELSRALEVIEFIDLINSASNTLTDVDVQSETVDGD